ncbi:MAG: hypothetical protein ACYTAF_12695, partial [Planctomycetota bacterium]
VSGYPLVLEGGQVVSVSPHLDQGVVYTGNANGKVFLIDESAGSVFRTYDFGAGLLLRGVRERDDIDTHMVCTGFVTYYLRDDPDPTPDITVSGTVYQSNGVTPLTGVTMDVALLVNGLLVDTRPVNTGDGTFTLWAPPETGVYTVYIEDHATYDAVLMTEFDGSGNLSALKLIHDRLVIDNHNAGATSNAQLDTGNNGDADITAIFADGGGTTLTVADGKSLHVAGAYTPGGNTSVGGNWVNNGTFSWSANAVTFNGSANQSIGGSTSTTFYDLTIANTGDPSAGVCVDVASETRVDNTLAVNDGCLLLQTAAADATIWLGSLIFGGAIVVAPAGWLELEGESDSAKARLAAMSGAFPFSFDLDGTLKAVWFKIDGVDSNGIMADGAANIRSLNFGRITSAMPTGQMLDLSAFDAADRHLLPCSFIDLEFGWEGGGAAYNIKSGANTPEVHVARRTVGAGPGAGYTDAWGETNDDEVANEIIWEGALIDVISGSGTAWGTMREAVEQQINTAGDDTWRFRFAAGSQFGWSERFDANDFSSVLVQAGDNVIFEDGYFDPRCGPAFEDTDADTVRRITLRNAVVITEGTEECTAENCTFFRTDSVNPSLPADWDGTDGSSSNSIFETGTTSGPDASNNITVATGDAGTYFRDAANGYFHLLSTAALARDNGFVLTYAFDWEGDARNYNGSWDIGADEYVGEAPTRPTDLIIENEYLPDVISDPTPDFNATHNDPDGHSADYYQIQVGDAAANGYVLSNGGVTVINNDGVEDQLTLNIDGAGDVTKDIAGTTLNNGDEIASAIMTAFTEVDCTYDFINAQYRITSLTTGAASSVVVGGGAGSAGDLLNLRASDGAAEVGGAAFTATEWDSGKTATAAVANGGQMGTAVAYGGATGLTWGKIYYFRIKYWDVYGLEGAWSITAGFTMDLPSVVAKSNGNGVQSGTGYRMLAFPIHGGTTITPGEVADDVAFWWGYKWNETDRTWDWVPAGGNLEGGQGYFIWTDADDVIDLGDGGGTSAGIGAIGSQIINLTYNFDAGGSGRG